MDVHYLACVCVGFRRKRRAKFLSRDGTAEESAIDVEGGEGRHHLCMELYGCRTSRVLSLDCALGRWHIPVGPQSVDHVVSPQNAACAAGTARRARTCVVRWHVVGGAIITSYVGIIRIPSGAWRGGFAVVVVFAASRRWRQYQEYVFPEPKVTPIHTRSG